MMPTNQQPKDTAKIIGQIKEIIAKNDSGIIVLPTKPTPDAIAASTALYMALTKIGKNITLVASVMPQSDLVGVDKIKTELNTGGDNLVISFPYEEGAIDKVDYNIKNERFNLVVIPREGHSKLEPKDVQFTYTGGKIEFIITIDTPNLNTIGDLYQKNQREFDGQTIINIDRHLINNSYGMINYVDKTSSSTSELVLKVIEGMKVQLNRDIATNLYAGVVAATNNFTAYSVNADTFEAVATLLRAGAVKKPVMPTPNQFARPQQQMPMGGGMGQRPSFPQRNSLKNFAAQQQRPMQRPASPQKMPYRQAEKQQRQIEEVEKAPQSQEGQTSGSAENDLKPKIFQESDGLI